jgi:hypothetical protein
MKSRKCIISSLSDWDELHVSHSFVPKYKGGKAPNDPNAEIFTLGKYYANALSVDIDYLSIAISDNDNRIYMVWEDATHRNHHIFFMRRNS